jgi:hypothetical protein
MVNFVPLRLYAEILHESKTKYHKNLLLGKKTQATAAYAAFEAEFPKGKKYSETYFPL